MPDDINLHNLTRVDLIDPTIADAIERLRRMPGLDDTRRRDLVSGLTGLCRMLGRPPESVPADPAAIRILRDGQSPMLAGVARKTLQNVMSNATAAFRTLGISDQKPARRIARTAAWQSLHDGIGDKGARNQLSRLSHYCSGEGIVPGDVDDAVIDRFLGMLRRDTLLDERRICGLHRATARTWNRLAESGEVTGLSTLVLPDYRPTPRTLHPEGFSHGFAADLEHYLQWLTGDDLFAEHAPPKRLKPTSIRLRRQQILIAATAWTQAGHDPKNLRSLQDLVTPAAVRDAMRSLLRRNDGETTQFIRDVCKALIQVARHYVRAPSEQITELKTISSKLGSDQAGLTSKNRTLLRKMEETSTRERLYGLPAKLIGFAGKRPGPERCAVTFQIALAIEFLLSAPLRMRNLVNLRIGTDLVPPDRKGGDWRVLLDGPQTKNGEPFELVLTDRLGGMIEAYIRKHRPALPGSASDHLFPGPEGNAKTASTLATQITEAIAEHVGIHMTPHQFRHLAAKTALDASPGNYMLAASLLGHKNLKTTISFYAGLRTKEAGRVFGEIVEQNRQRKGRKKS